MALCKTVAHGCMTWFFCLFGHPIYSVHLSEIPAINSAVALLWTVKSQVSGTMLVSCESFWFLQLLFELLGNKSQKPMLLQSWILFYEKGCMPLMLIQSRDNRKKQLTELLSVITLIYVVLATCARTNWNNWKFFLQKWG